MPIAAPPAELTSRLRMVTMRLSRLLRQHGGAALSPALVSALGSVARCGPVTLGRLAEIEGVQPPSMTRVVAQLEQLQLVTREVDGADRRVARLTITPDGERPLADVRLRRNELLAARLGDPGPADVAAIEAALAALERLAGLQQ